MFFLFVFFLRNAGTQNEVEVFAGNKIRRFFFHLFLREVRQDIRYAKYRIVRSFADRHIDDAAVGFAHNAVNRKRQRYPLIFFNTAVIVRIQIHDTVFFIDGILLYVQARRIDVRAEDIHAVFETARADFKQSDGFVHFLHIHFIAGFQRFICRDVFITALFRRFDDPYGTLAFGFSAV